MAKFKIIKGGITAPKGFKASGINAGIKNNKLDMALIVSDVPASTAGVFTKNRIQGAPVKVCKDRLKGKVSARAVIINSGKANACVGPRGIVDAERMCTVVGDILGIDGKTVLVSSTGTIGLPLPMDKIEKGIGLAVDALSSDGGADAAKAIMTTDKVAKQVSMSLDIGGVEVRIGAMAKGSGMIEPDMATMLAYITTDAAVDEDALQSCLKESVEQSFNKISVDGDQSCNDTVLFLANGMAGNDKLNREHPDWHNFCEAVNVVTKDLALKIVEDGEGVTKVVTVNVRGAVSDEDAYKAVRHVGRSLLVKTSWYGCDPNWGRVIDALGYSGAEVKEEMVDISYDDTAAVMNGQMAPGFKLADLEKILAQKRFSLNIDLNLGKASDVLYTCDCSEEYVRINSEYMT